MEFNHYSVMLNECIEGLNIKEDGIYLDCTLGGAGHSEEILKKLDKGLLIAFDKDQDAIDYSEKKLKKYINNLKIIKSDFKEAPEILDELKIDKIDGFLIDLGVSSHQIDVAERGFSYINDAPLDMRMDKEQVLTAKKIVNSYTEENLSKILYIYSEEKFSKQIARNIVKYREKKQIETTLELTKIIDESMPLKFRYSGSHNAKKTFQALRIETNHELDGLYELISKLIDRLKIGGRAVIISFHSLEDRIVKHVFQEKFKDCVCPERQMICTCNKKREIEILTKKPIVATEKEMNENTRSKSAKLRIAEKII